MLIHCFFYDLVPIVEILFDDFTAFELHQETDEVAPAASSANEFWTDGLMDALRALEARLQRFLNAGGVIDADLYLIP